MICLKEQQEQWQKQKKDLTRIFERILEQKKSLDKSKIKYSTLDTTFFDSEKFKTLTSIVKSSDKNASIDSDFVMESEYENDPSEFISLILQQVDDLCEKIKHGDPDIQRALEVNKNLNDAVSCYVNKLMPKRKNEEKRKIGRPKTEKPLIEFSDPCINQKTDEYLQKIEKGCSELDVPFDKFVSKLATRYYFTNGENQDKKKGHMFNKVTLLEFSDYILI